MRDFKRRTKDFKVVITLKLPKPLVSVKARTEREANKKAFEKLQKYDLLKLIRISIEGSKPNSISSLLSTKDTIRTSKDKGTITIESTDVLRMAKKLCSIELPNVQASVASKV
jgi:hypothetical protein